MKTIPLALALLTVAAPARAQIDDAKRLMLEGGYEDGIANPGANGAYAFLYLNRPGVAGKGSALRMALAPVYADAELGLPEVLPRTDLGLGFSGGGFAFSRKEVVRGDQHFGESFIGHGGGPSVSLYPKLGSVGPAPLNGVLRGSLVYTDYQRTAQTDANFTVPPDEWTGVLRAGLRLGGQEPGLSLRPAAELSAWWEGRKRDRPAEYGYAGDRSVRREIHLYWLRALISIPDYKGIRASGGAGIGGGTHLGRLAAYRLGGMLTQSAEFPLVIPGYFAQEIAAREYGHLWAKAGVPVRGSKRFFANLSFAGASVTPIARTDPGGSLHAGFGLGLEFAPADAAFHGELSYGYSPTAVRGAGRGGHGIALTVELDFMAPDEDKAKTRRGAKTQQQGLGWLFGR